MQEVKEPYFFKYFDPNTGGMRKDAPAQAKKDFRKWQRESDAAESKDIERLKGGKK